ncbi:SPOR domain-containing protein [Denitrobaculum tricleocarpae]|uniref:SPOR domain-containing protein n=1 Tax=Denitrobaculum tricleocarpae TaxID=2591009 RepID=A0A545TT92_9PROT|nr:SPOR domain-containing protein [Denitrobaculum tricleocarpae]TQV80432.1 hypothetical protein FKG95_09640 [Denitrobaculum tricleocarpae]
MTFAEKSRAIRPFALISLLTLGGLTGCQQTYDDTKGWGNDVEAWFREDFIKDVKASIDDIGEEISGLSGAETAQSTATPDSVAVPQTADAEKSAAETLSEGMTASPETISEQGRETQVASTAPEIPSVTTDAPAQETPKPAATSQTARPNLYPQTAGKPPAETAKAETAPAKPKPAVKQVAGKQKADMALHLSSNKTKESAMREWTELKKAFPDQLGGLNLEIARTDLGKKGVFFRVMAGPFADKPAAARVCSELKKKEQYCAVMQAPAGQSQAQSARIESQG